MRVLVLTATPRLPDFVRLYEFLSRHLTVDVRYLDKGRQRNLRLEFKDIAQDEYACILIDLPFKNIVKQAGFLSRLPRLVLYEQDACQNYIAHSSWFGRFSNFYKKLPRARIVVTGAAVSKKLAAEGFDVVFMPKAFDEYEIFNESDVERDIELGFIGRTASGAYKKRKDFLDALALSEPLQVLRTEPGAEYRRTLCRIRYFISADIGLDEYMAKNFEAMACGCVLLAWRQGSEELAIGLEHGQHLLLYSSLAELRDHLACLRSDQQLANRLASAGQAFVTSQLSYECLAARLAALLQEPWPEKPVPASGWQRLSSLFGLRMG